MSYQQQQQQHATVAALLKKTSHYDKDERYMATSDLCELLKRHQCASQDTSTTTTTTTVNNTGNINTTTATAYLDAATEREICTTVLRLLHDKSHDVQAVAVKTLGVLLTAVQQEQVLEIADSLADQVLDASKSELRDVYTIGLRTLVKTCPDHMGQAVSQRLLTRLLDGIRTSSNVSSTSSSTTTATNKNNREEIVLACLDVLTDLLGRFGSTAIAVTRQHEPILQLCLQLLSSSSTNNNNITNSTSTSTTTTTNSSGATSEVVRKRAGNTLACLSTVLSDTLVQRMVEALLRQIDVASTIGSSRVTRSSLNSSSTPLSPTTTLRGVSRSMSSGGVADTRSLIRTMCAVSGAVGHRLGQAQIDRILPIFLRFTRRDGAVTGDDDDDDGDDVDNYDDNNNNKNDNDDAKAFHDNKNNSEAESTEATALANELRESCFMGFESFVLRCPVEVEPHLESIITAALAYMSYDPNYSYGRQEEDGYDDAAIVSDNEEDDDEEDDYEDEDEADEDDDDESWKVRRSAIRALCAVVETKKHNPTTLWTVPYSVRRGKAPVQVSRALVHRFKEREETCRVGVMDCFNRLLSVTIEAGQPLLTTADDMITTDRNTIDWQADYAPGLVKACETILAVKKGNDRSKSAALALLATLCKAPGGVGGASEIASVFQHVQTFLAVDPTNQAMLHRGGGEGTSKALRLDALSLVYALLESHTHDPVHIRTSLRKWMLPELCQAVQEQWYKVIAEALRALSEVPRFFVLGYKESEDPVNKETERKEVATQLYEAIEPLLAAHDVDQEIKECALKACASLLSSLHSSLTLEQKTRLLSLLLDRLTNETTRISAIKTMASVAGSKSGCSLTPILAESIAAMASFLKLSSRSLKQSSLEALDIVVTNHGSDPVANEELYAIVLQELAPLITDRDLHLSHLSL